MRLLVFILSPHRFWLHLAPFALIGVLTLWPLVLLRAQMSPSDAFDSSPLVLDPFSVEGEDTAAADYDPTGLDGHRAELNEPPFANELLSDAAFSEMPLAELENELESLAAARSNAAEIAAGSENLNLRGFPAPLRRNGFSQSGIPEVLNPDGSELVIGSLVPVIGRAAPGGIRNVRTARPAGRTTRQLEASTSSNGFRSARGRTTGVIKPKKSWFLASAGVSESDGPQRFAESTQSTARVALAFRHSKATSTLWSFDVFDLQGNPAPGIPDYRLTPTSPIVGPYLPLAEFHTYGPRASVARQAASLGFQLESQLRPDLSLSSSTQLLGRRSEQDRFTTGQYIVSTGVFSGVREPTHREEGFRGVTHQTDLTQRFYALGADHKVQVSVESTLAGDSDENRGLLPADRLALLPETVRTFDPNAPDYYRPDYSPAVYKRLITDRENRFFHAAAVASLRTAVNHGRTVFSTGLRRDFSHIEVNDHRVTATFPHTEKSVANTSAHLGVNQRIGRQVLVFATASSAVQPSTRVDSRTGQIQDNASTSGVELGARATVLERTLTLGIMGYSYTNAHIVRRNPLYQDPVDDANQTQPQLVSSGEELFRGITAQVGWKPTPAWTATARAVWTDASTVSSPDLPEEEGLPLTRLPAFSAATGLRYAFKTGPLSGLALRGNVTYIDRTVQDYARSDRLRLESSDYTLASIGADYTWRAGKVTHTINSGIQNLLDSDLLTRAYRVGAGRSLAASWRVAF